MKKNKKWLIMLADSFIARAVAIFLFFLAIITGIKEFFLSSNDFISKYSVPYFILSIIISIIISAMFTFYLKGYKISDSTNIDNMDNDDGVKSRFVDMPKQVQFKEFLIERETQSAFTVRGGSTVVRLDLSDRETAKKQLMDSFGVTATKAEKIISKAQKQKLTSNLLNKAKEKVKNSADTLRNKKIERGSRK